MRLPLGVFTQFIHPAEVKNTMGRKNEVIKNGTKFDTRKIIKEVNKILNSKGKKGQILKLWDGKTARRIVRILCERIKN